MAATWWFHEDGFTEFCTTPGERDDEAGMYSDGSNGLPYVHTVQGGEAESERERLRGREREAESEEAEMASRDCGVDVSSVQKLRESRREMVMTNRAAL